MQSMKKLTIILLIFAFVFSAIVFKPSPSYGSDTPQVWFMPKQGATFKNEVINLIKSANTELDIAVYDIGDSDIVYNIVQEYKRGIKVRVITDDKEYTYEENVLSPLANIKVLETDHSTSDYMHDKFMVVDSHEVLTGSTNWTNNGFNYNNNNAILFNSAELAKEYETEFNQMWNGKFGTAKEPSSHEEVTTDGVVVHCYFSPEDDVEQRIVSEISKAKTSIDFATFTFTSKPIEDALVKKIQQGVRVRGIYEARQKSQWCTYNVLEEAGAKVIYDKNPKTMHDKYFIIDGKTVITGSYNPTKHAEEKNDENIVIMQSPEIAKKYQDDFNGMFSSWAENVQTDSQIEIVLQPNNPYMLINGVKKEIDPGRGTKPVIIPKWSRTVVPIRAIVEALGGTIGWDGAERKVTINFNGTTIELWIDNPKAKVNGAAKWIDENNHDVKPIIINSRTMLPLRFVVENLGCKVDWDSETKTITITYNGSNGGQKGNDQNISLKIEYVNYDAPGNDNKNPNGEWVKIKNEGNVPINMTGYKIKDEQGHCFNFPKDFILKANGEVTIYTGSGVDTDDKLYWGNNMAIWNNSGDTCYLISPDGKVIDEYSW